MRKIVFALVLLGALGGGCANTQSLREQVRTPHVCLQEDVYARMSYEERVVRCGVFPGKMNPHMLV